MTSKKMEVKINDLVFPCYDGKLSRGTLCKVIEVTEQGCTVRGNFWGDEAHRLLSAEFTYDEEGRLFSWVSYDKEPTLMDMLGVSSSEKETGDYYILNSYQYMESLVEEGFMKKDYFDSLLLDYTYDRIYAN
jgi:hypothetical protein